MLLKPRLGIFLLQRNMSRCAPADRPVHALVRACRSRRTDTAARPDMSTSQQSRHPKAWTGHSPLCAGSKICRASLAEARRLVKTPPQPTRWHPICSGCSPDMFHRPATAHRHPDGHSLLQPGSPAGFRPAFPVRLAAAEDHPDRHHHADQQPLVTRQSGPDRPKRDCASETLPFVIIGLIALATLLLVGLCASAGRDMDRGTMGGLATVASARSWRSCGWPGKATPRLPSSAERRAVSRGPEQATGLGGGPF